MTGVGKDYPVIRARLLRAAADGRTFSVPEMSDELSVPEGELAKVIAELVRNDMIENQSLPGEAPRQYRVSAKGLEMLESMQAGQIGNTDERANNMWRTARKLRGFSPVDLMAYASVPGAEVDLKRARDFCALLLKGGYVRVTRKAKHGVREASYRLVKNTGPRPPIEKRLRVVYDPNEQCLVHIPEVKHDR